MVGTSGVLQNATSGVKRLLTIQSQKLLLWIVTYHTVLITDHFPKLCSCSKLSKWLAGGCQLAKFASLDSMDGSFRCFRGNTATKVAH